MRAMESKAPAKRSMRATVAPRSYARPKALICKSGPEDVLDHCLLCLSGEVDVEQVRSLGEGLKRCLDGNVDILFVNLFSYTAGELTALAAFRDMRPEIWVVAITRPEMSETVLGFGLANEVFVGAAPRHDNASQGSNSAAL
jgi:hypothetical protein